MELVAVDVGGTHARFAIAREQADGGWSLSDEAVLRVAEHRDFAAAWAAYAARTAWPLPDMASLAVAGPADSEIVELTNNPWVIRRAELVDRLGLRDVTIVNDFGAVGYAVDRLGADAFVHLCGPDRALPDDGGITIVGPGTGLGVAQLIRRGDGPHVVQTVGGHMDFAPLDAVDDALLARLRRRHGRVSVERVCAGPGLPDIHATLAALEGQEAAPVDDKTLWALALAGNDRLASAALDRFCMSLGALAGDLAIAHGARAVVVAGGLGLRLADHLQGPGFRDRFVAKGRFRDWMEALPVKLVTHPQPGLLGAAAAFRAMAG